MLVVNGQPSLDYYLRIPELLERHQNSKPPQEAYMFIPNNSEIILFNEDKPNKTLRRIFEMKYADFCNFEKERMKILEGQIKIHNEKNKDNQLIFQEDYKTSDKFRYLQATGYKESKTIGLLIENIKWRTTKIPPIISSKVVELLNCGFIYIHGRDINFRPIMVINATYYLKLKEIYSFDDWINCVIYFMEYSINNLLVPGQIENWNIIMDLTGISLIFLPSDLKKVIGILQSNYRCRLFVNFIIGMSAILKGIWSFISSFLDETTVRKIRFLNNDNMNELFGFINHDQVEKRFGGNATDLIPGGNNIFPPIFPNNKNLFESNRSGGRLLSEEEYREMYINGLITTPSPYLIQKWREAEEKLKQQEIEIIKKQNEELEMKNIIYQEEINYKNKIHEETHSRCNTKESMNKINFSNYLVLNEYTPRNQEKMKNLKINISRIDRNDSSNGRLSFITPEVIKFDKKFAFDSRNSSKILNYQDESKISESKIGNKSERSNSVYQNLTNISESNKIFEDTKIIRNCSCFIY